MESIFIQISLLLAITVFVAFVVRMLKQPLIFAYIIAGMICGPAFFNFIHHDIEMYKFFAQIGIVLLLFIIGLSLNINKLKNVGKNSFIAGIGQFLFTAIFALPILLAFGLPITGAVFLAIAMTFSSTIIIAKLVSDKNDTETVYGKHAIGLMIVQDILAVGMMIVINILSQEASLSQAILWLTLKLALAIIILFYISKYILPKLLHKVSLSAELLFIFTLAWCFGIASLIYVLGLSFEIGAILAGIALSSSPYNLQITSRLKPLRDFFLILFFILLGSEISFGTLEKVWHIGLIMSVFVLIFNPLILYIIFRRLHFTRRNSFLCGITAGQVSEFGFVLLFSASAFGIINGQETAIFTIVATVTIFFSSIFILHSGELYKKFLPFFNIFGKDKYKQRNIGKKQYDVWVVGYHRIGQKVAYALKDLKVKFCVIDFDPTVLEKLNKDKMPSVFGDIADIEFLRDLPLGSAKKIIMSIPSKNDQINLIRYVKDINPKAIIIANAYHLTEVDDLYQAGASYVMTPHLMGANWIARIIRDNKITEKFLARLKEDEKPYYTQITNK